MHHIQQLTIHVHIVASSSSFTTMNIVAIVTLTLKAIFAQTEHTGKSGCNDSYQDGLLLKLTVALWIASMAELVSKPNFHRRSHIMELIEDRGKGCSERRINISNHQRLH